MTVLEFFGCRVAHAHDLHVEMQGFVGERMIAVERHHVADDRSYREQPHTVVGPALKLQAVFDLSRTLHRAFGDALDERGIVRAIPFRGGHGHCQGIAVLLALEGRLQAREQIAMSLNRGEWSASGRAVDDRSVIILEGVMNEY